MPKQKTKKGVSKRMKVTAKGGLKRTRSSTRHLKSFKGAKANRRNRASVMTSKAYAKTYLSVHKDA